ncbi:hypothetical protein ACIRYZ_45880 [Kitasatospora sp. NPDC101155]|uniref:hypothetical protein n=1 Tax=Kitasatospora sp. NPDC101155 TaxID=3364097 RepID=UPI00381D8A83
MNSSARRVWCPPTSQGQWGFVSSGARAHAADLAAGDKTETVRRGLDWLLAETITASRLTEPYREPLALPLAYPPPHHLGIATVDQALDFLAVRGPHLGAALDAAEKHHPAVVPTLVFAAWPWYRRTRHYSEWLHHHTRAIDILSNPSTDVERRLYRELHGSRAVALRETGHIYDAIADCNLALAMARGTDDRPGTAQHFYDLGATYRLAGAHGYLTRAQRLWISLDRRRGAALAHMELALTDADLGEDSAALLDRLSIAERDLAATGDYLNSAKALAWRGRALACDGRLVEARPTLADALDAFRAQDSRIWEACVLSWLADIDAACGRTGDAIALLRHSAALYEHHSPQDHARVTEALRALHSR